MKTAALLLLSSAATVQGAAHMSSACDVGCAMQGQGCARTQTHKTMMEIWGGPGIANPPGFLTASKPGGGTGTAHGSPVQGVAQASDVGAPFICKPKAGRRLAAHMAGTFRVAVAGAGSDKAARMKTLSKMTTDDYIKGLVLIDGSMDNSNPVVAAPSGGRLLGAHAKTIMMMKTWSDKAKLSGQNPCFDFELPNAWGVTYLKAAAQRENGNNVTGGLFFSDNVKVSEIPDCPTGMHSRRLDGHADKCTKITMPASCLPEANHGAGDKKKASAGSLITTATGAIIMAAATSVLAVTLA